MISKYHNHKLQTTPWYREEEPLNHHETPGRQIKQSNQQCHFMRVTQHHSHKQILHDYTLHQQTLENVQPAKYLGITITENMDWGQPISDISSKAAKIFCFLCRNLAFAPRSTKDVAYKKISEYDQEIPQSQTADDPVVPRERATQPSRDTWKTKQSNQLSLPHQDDCNTRMDIK